TLTILAGRPSMGKSAIANYFTLQMATKHQLPAVYFSLEMTKNQLQYRLWSLISEFHCYSHHNLTKIRGDRLRKQRAGKITLTSSEMDSIAKIIAICAELPIFINDNRGISVAGIASECRRIKARVGNLGLVVVDYLQMMAGENASGNRSYDLGDVARGLYKLAGEIDAPILALSQVSRGVETRQDKRPMMSDLSQSGILEMVADNVIFAYRDEYYNPDTIRENILELILAKARHGDTGKIELLFDKSCGMIDSLKAFEFN
ncbi:MAG: replicative DNA helicase, partial [Waterburya sp.]